MLQLILGFPNRDGALWTLLVSFDVYQKPEHIGTHQGFIGVGMIAHPAEPEVSIVDFLHQDVLADIMLALKDFLQTEQARITPEIRAQLDRDYASIREKNEAYKTYMLPEAQQIARLEELSLKRGDGITIFPDHDASNEPPIPPSTKLH